MGYDLENICAKAERKEDVIQVGLDGIKFF
jgi:hypothetical protein